MNISMVLQRKSSVKSLRLFVNDCEISSWEKSWNGFLRKLNFLWKKIENFRDNRNISSQKCFLLSINDPDQRENEQIDKFSASNNSHVFKAASATRNLFSPTTKWIPVDNNYPFQANMISHLWIFTDWGKIHKKFFYGFLRLQVRPSKMNFCGFQANLP